MMVRRMWSAKSLTFMQDQAMKNIKTCLDAAGSGVEKIVRRRMYFMDIKNDIKTVMDVWDQYVPKPHPVSTAVQVRCPFLGRQWSDLTPSRSVAWPRKEL